MTETLEATYGLSPVQQGMLFHHLSHPNSGVDIEQIVASLEEDLDPAALRTAWERVAERHAVLRTSFRWENVEEPVQQVHARIEIPIDIEDWREPYRPPSTRARLAERLRVDRDRGFDLRGGAARAAGAVPTRRRSAGRCSGPFLTSCSMAVRSRSCWTRCSRSTTRSVVAPGWTCRRRRPTAITSSISRDSISRRAERFWRARLAGFRAPTPLPGSPAAGTPTGRGERELSLSEETTSALARVAREADVSVGTLVQGAFALLLARMSGESDVVFGATRAGRATSVPGADGIVGLFIATLPVRVGLRPEQSLADWLRALRASEREARPHEHTPLVELQGWSELRAGAPLFESLLVFDHSLLDSQMRAKGPAYETRRFRLHERTNYALTLYAYARAAPAAQARLRRAALRRRRGGPPAGSPRAPARGDRARPRAAARSGDAALGRGARTPRPRLERHRRGVRARGVRAPR